MHAGQRGESAFGSAPLRRIVRIGVLPPPTRQLPAMYMRCICRSPVYLPYIYYSHAQASYVPHQLVGDNLSTPKRGQCKPGGALGDSGCTWLRCVVECSLDFFHVDPLFSFVLPVYCALPPSLSSPSLCVLPVVSLFLPLPPVCGHSRCLQTNAGRQQCECCMESSFCRPGGPLPHRQTRPPTCQAAYSIAVSSPRRGGYWTIGWHRGAAAVSA